MVIRGNCDPLLYFVCPFNLCFSRTTELSLKLITINHRIQKFTPEGQFVCSFGTMGSQPGQLYCPAGVTVDDNDLVYVSDRSDYISVYIPNGEYKCCIQKHCNKKDCDIPDQPTPGVSCSTSGDLCVCCYNDGKIVHL